MTKTNFSAKSDAFMPRQRNILRKKAPAGFAEIFDQQGPPERSIRPSATVKPRKQSKHHEGASAEFGQGPTGTVIADMQLRPPKRDDDDSILEQMRKQTLPYAQTRGTFVRVPTFSDLGRDAASAEPEDAPIPIERAYSDDPWLPPAPSWGQSQGPTPELVRTPPGDDLLAMAIAATDDDSGEIELLPELGWEDLDPDVEPMVDLEEALSAFEMALTVRDDASSLDEEAANFAPLPSLEAPATDAPEHGPSFLSALPTVSSEVSPTYGADGNVFTSVDPESPVARNVEVFRTALNRAAIMVDTDDGQIELAITTAGKHVMVEATAAAGFTDAIQRDLDALRSALDRHDLELTELAFGGTGADAGGSEQPEHSADAQPPSIVPAPEHIGNDVGFRDDGAQTWVIPTGFRVVA